MRLPSIKTIQENFPYLHSDDVKKVREILEKNCDRPIKCLRKIDPIIEGHGLEYIADEGDSYTEFNGIEYINMGDSYAATFCYDRTSGRIFISSWRDIVEKNSKRFGG